MADLVVELYGTRAGVLAGTWREFDFLPDPAAAIRFGIDSPILSAAIPLTVAAVRSRKQRRQNFFRELLPEGRMLSRLAQRAGLVEQDAIGLLRAYGRDVADALQIWDPDVPANQGSLSVVLHLASTEAPGPGAYAGLAGDIARFAANLLAGQETGRSEAHH